MRRWINWAARCYPTAWRERYGDEFAALLDDAEPRWQDLWDVLREAIFMQLTTPAAYLKFGVVTALIGAIAAGAASFAIPKRYASTAVLRPAHPLDATSAQKLRQQQAEILSRGSLAEVIQRPGIDLYREERRRYPMEDLLEAMRDRDLRIQTVNGPTPGTPPAIRMTFEYADPRKAQAVVRDLSARFANEELEIETPASLPETPVGPDRLSIIAIGLSAGLAVGVVLAFLRGRGVKWTLKTLACGLAGALAASAVCLLWPDGFLDRRGYEFVGLGTALGLTVGAFFLRQRRPGGGYAAQVAFYAVCCAIVGAFASFAVPDHYVSSALMRAFKSPSAAAVLDGDPAERVRLLTEDALSRSSLAEVIQRPALDLYRAERSRFPMEDVIQQMRTHDLRIDSARDPGLADPGAVTFRISFRYTDRFKAQAVAREMVTKLTEGNVLLDRKLHPEVPGGAVSMEVFNPPNLPAESIAPNRPVYAVVGFAVGALLGLLLVWRRRRAEAPPGAAPVAQPRYARYALAAAALSALAAGLASFAMPERYVSTAVLRVAVPAGQNAAARAEEMIQQVLTRDTLEDLVQSPALDLYSRDRARRPMNDVLQVMRDRDLRLTPLSDGAHAARTAAFRISFEYADRVKAQGCVQAVIDRLIERRKTGAEPRDVAHLFDINLAESALPQKLDGPVVATPAAPAPRASNPSEFFAGAASLSPVPRGGDLLADSAVARADDFKLEVLDAASVPGTPVTPNRTAITAGGGLAGLMLGLMLARLRRRSTA